jgi:hypothetical protein
LTRDEGFLDFSDYARPLALKVVQLFLKTPISSIQVTFLFLVAGLLAALCLSVGSYAMALLAICLIQLKNLLDAVDGSLARAKGTQSYVGRYLDSIFDFIVHVALYSALYIYLIKTNRSEGQLFFAFFAMIAALIQCSLFNYYSVTYRRLRTGTDFSSIDEARHQPLNLTEAFLQKVYLVIYGWQDSLVYRLDGFKSLIDPKTGQSHLTDSKDLGRCYLNQVFMGSVSLLGLGTQLLLMSVFILFGRVDLFFLTVCFVGNGIFIILLLWTHFRAYQLRQSS